TGHVPVALRVTAVIQVPVVTAGARSAVSVGRAAGPAAPVDGAAGVRAAGPRQRRRQAHAGRGGSNDSLHPLAPPWSGPGRHLLRAALVPRFTSSSWCS